MCECVEVCVCGVCVKVCQGVSRCVKVCQGVSFSLVIIIHNRSAMMSAHKNLTIGLNHRN